MNTTATTRRINAYTVVAAIVKIYLVGALAISFSHIVTASAMLGLTGWQAWTVPAFIDGFAILGLIGRSESVASRTENPAAVRRFGFRLQLVAGTLSLAANVFAGHTVGERAFGALVVTGFMVAEKYSEKLRAASTTKTEITAADVQAAVDAAIAQTLAQAAAATQAAIATAVTEALAADAADRRKAEQAAKRRERAAAKRLAEIAPVSPGIDGVAFDAELGYAPAYAKAYA